jgi:hypothetical protein
LLINRSYFDVSLMLYFFMVLVICFWRFGTECKPVPC